MAIMIDKYRGTTTYVHVLAELVRATQYRSLTTYQDTAVIMAPPARVAHGGRYRAHPRGDLRG